MPTCFKTEFLMLLLLFSNVYGTGYGGGSGAASDPYRIYDANQLNQIGLNQSEWSSYFILMADIDLSAYDGRDGRPQFNMIGNYELNLPFRGNFNGSGHYIKNFRFTSESRNHVGVFSFVGNNYPTPSRIYNLGIIDSEISSSQGNNVGALVGTSNWGEISGCCTYSTTVQGNTRVGGLIGNCSETTVKDCYSLASVQGNDWVGGLVGYSSVRKMGANIICCYAAGAVSGGSNVNGLYGGTPGAIDAFWDKETTGQAVSAGGKGKTSAEMKVALTFASWACNPVWTIADGLDYPRLSWQNMPGELIQLPFFGGGDGTAQNPYLIYTADQLNKVGLYRCNLSKAFKLMNDIDLAGFDGQSGRPVFNIIGKSETFRGIFDGNNHFISNFIYNSQETAPAGLFASVQGMLKNITILAPCINAPNAVNVGALAGSGNNAVNCHIIGGSVTAKDNVGSLFGNAGNNYETIQQCSASGTCITALGQNAGGLVGNTYSMNVISCFADCNVSAHLNAGGLSGYSDWTKLKNSYSLGQVVAIDSAGGIIGYVTGEGSMVEHVYTAAQINCELNAGGLVGKGEVAVSDSYWDTNTTGQQTNHSGGNGKDTIQMKSPATYIGWGAQGQWRLNDTNDYPRLAWENTAGNLITRKPYPYGGGSGTEQDPYLIFTYEQLNTVGLLEDDWTKCFKLMADIDCNHDFGTFNVIGNLFQSYSGVFDGNNRIINRFSLNVPARMYSGFFGSTGNNAKTRNLVFDSPDVNVGSYSAVLLGRIGGDNTTIENCFVREGKVQSTGGYIGGIVGYGLYADNITITKCSFSGTVSAGFTTGGLAGYISDCTVKQCSSRGEVSGTDEIGGLIGSVSNPVTVENCYSRADVTGTYAAGLIGDVWDYWYPVYVRYCYASGKVNGGGGLNNGMSFPSTATYSYWDTIASGQTTSSGGQGKTTSQMKSQATYSGWDFVNTWAICQNTNYPRLKWEIPQADFVCPDGVTSKEYAIIASQWLNSGCNGINCGNADLDRSGSVDFSDMALLVQDWLTGF